MDKPTKYEIELCKTIPFATEAQTKDKNYLLFVYGSLKRGYHNHPLLINSIYHGKGNTFYDNYAMYSFGGYPVVIHKNQGTQIRGEIYECTLETIFRINRLEGHPTFYKGSIQRIQTKKPNEILRCLMYIYQDDKDTLNPENYPLITTGNWKEEHIYA
jgi:gamma-glutamylaminecyclotransferase